MSLTLNINDQKPVVEETTATVTDIVATGEKSVVVGERGCCKDRTWSRGASPNNRRSICRLDHLVENLPGGFRRRLNELIRRPD